MRVTIVSVIAGTIAAVPAVVQAQDIQQGHQLALEVCSACHAVLAGQAQSPLEEAPSFEAVAATPGMTAAALNVWLTAQDPMFRTSRPTFSAWGNRHLPIDDCEAIVGDRNALHMSFHFFRYKRAVWLSRSGSRWTQSWNPGRSSSPF